MTLIYDWIIGTAKVASMNVGTAALQDVLVTITEVRCLVTDEAGNTNSDITSGKCPFNLNPPDPAAFTALDQLSHAQVVAWVLPRLGESEVSDLKAKARRALTEQTRPVPAVPGPTFAPATTTTEKAS